MSEEQYRQRAKSRIVRVTFPSGKVICHKSAINTLIGALKEIGSARFPEITLELNHLPLLSQTIYPRFKDWMKPVCDGWYINTQSNTDQKYMQLRSISDSLGLNLNVEIGSDFETQDSGVVCSKKKKEYIKVTFADGDELFGYSTIETFTNTLVRLGIDEVMRKELEWGGIPLISRAKMSNRQIEIAPSRWLTIPNTTNDKIKVLRVVAIHLRIALNISVVAE